MLSVNKYSYENGLWIPTVIKRREPTVSKCPYCPVEDTHADGDLIYPKYARNLKEPSIPLLGMKNSLPLCIKVKKMPRSHFTKKTKDPLNPEPSRIEIPKQDYFCVKNRGIEPDAGCFGPNKTFPCTGCSLNSLSLHIRPLRQSVSLPKPVDRVDSTKKCNLPTTHSVDKQRKSYRNEENNPFVYFSLRSSKSDHHQKQRKAEIVSKLTSKISLPEIETPKKLSSIRLNRSRRSLLSSQTKSSITESWHASVQSLEVDSAPLLIMGSENKSDSSVELDSTYDEIFKLLENQESSKEDTSMTNKEFDLSKEETSISKQETHDSHKESMASNKESIASNKKSIASKKSFASNKELIAKSIASNKELIAANKESAVSIKELTAANKEPTAPSLIENVIETQRQPSEMSVASSKEVDEPIAVRSQDTITAEFESNDSEQEQRPISKVDKKKTKLKLNEPRKMFFRVESDHDVDKISPCGQYLTSLPSTFRIHKNKSIRKPEEEKKQNMYSYLMEIIAEDSIVTTSSPSVVSRDKFGFPLSYQQEREEEEEFNDEIDLTKKKHRRTRRKKVQQKSPSPKIAKARLARQLPPVTVLNHSVAMTKKYEAPKMCRSPASYRSESISREKPVRKQTSSYISSLSLSKYLKQRSIDSCPSTPGYQKELETPEQSRKLLNEPTTTSRCDSDESNRSIYEEKKYRAGGHVSKKVQQKPKVNLPKYLHYKKLRLSKSKRKTNKICPFLPYPYPVNYCYPEFGGRSCEFRQEKVVCSVHTNRSECLKYFAPVATSALPDRQNLPILQNRQCPVYPMLAAPCPPLNVCSLAPPGCPGIVPLAYSPYLISPHFVYPAYQHPLDVSACKKESSSYTSYEPQVIGASYDYTRMTTSHQQPEMIKKYAKNHGILAGHKIKEPSVSHKKRSTDLATHQKWDKKAFLSNDIPSRVPSKTSLEPLHYYPSTSSGNEDQSRCSESLVPTKRRLSLSSIREKMAKARNYAFKSNSFVEGFRRKNESDRKLTAKHSYSRHNHSKNENKHRRPIYVYDDDCFDKKAYLRTESSTLLEILRDAARE